MKVLSHRPSLGAVALLATMFAVVALAAFGPATGVVLASSSCNYGTCTSAEPGPLTWALGIIVAAIILLIAAAVILQRRRGRPPSSGVAAYEGPTPPGGAAGGPESPATAEGAPYLETAEDVGVMGGGVAIAGAAAGGAAAGAAGEEAPGDIDSLMGELDRISGEILKRGPGKKPPTGGAEDEAATGGS
jgi:hypothetical protein